MINTINLLSLNLIINRSTFLLDIKRNIMYLIDIDQDEVVLTNHFSNERKSITLSLEDFQSVEYNDFTKLYRSKSIFNKCEIENFSLYGESLPEIKE